MKDPNSIMPPWGFKCPVDRPFAVHLDMLLEETPIQISAQQFFCYTLIFSGSARDFSSFGCRCQRDARFETAQTPDQYPLPRPRPPTRC